jgi:RNA polymerase sigma factor (sigma-70 family)
MEQERTEQRLSKISTAWTMLHQAHAGKKEQAAAAQQLLLQRYRGAVYRYLLAALRDPHAADDLTQEFALSLVRGDFRKAQPEQGRFRNYVKTVLFHLVSKYRKRQQRDPRAELPDSDDPEAGALAVSPEDTERQFIENWRNELLARAWEALAEAQPTFYSVLRFRAAHPKMPSPEMAQKLGRQLGKPLTQEGVRQTLHRARTLFAELLLEAVAHSVEPPTTELVEQELSDLNLLVYCQPALQKRAGGQA